MAMNVTKLKAGTSTRYFASTIKEVITDHGGGMADYYNTTGTPPGVWMGNALDTIGVHEGDTASKNDVTKVYDLMRNPRDDQRLSRHSDKALKSGQVVAGYDLTFSLPKSVNILWASGDEHVRRTIMACHEEAMRETLASFEAGQAYSRKGAGGVVKQRVDGIIACRFTHWDTRDHDPHLHDHVLVSNIARREDGQLGALDGKALYTAGVSLSEQHTNLIMDKLTESLGVQWRRRDTGDSKASVYDLVGIDDQLIGAFSQRRLRVEQERDRLTEQAKANGVPLSEAVLRRIDRQAWKATRKSKPKEPESLHDLMGRWSGQMRGYGIDPAMLVEDCTGRDRRTLRLEMLLAGTKGAGLDVEIGPLLDDCLRDDAAQDPAEGGALERLHEDAKSGVTLISEGRIRAAAERLTRGIRIRPGERGRLTDALVEQERARLVELTPGRYRLTDRQERDRQLGLGNGRAVTDYEEGRLYATQELIDAEKQFIELAGRHDAKAGLWNHLAIDEAIQESQRGAKHPLAEDQREAVGTLLAGDTMIAALSGPAGAGKTTTLRGFADAVRLREGEGRVLALAPTSAAAIELGASLDAPAETMAKILYERSTGHTDNLLRRACDQYERTAPGAKGRRQALRERISSLDAQLKAMEIPQDGYVIVDEAGMADTPSITRLAELCAAHGAKMIMVGDDMQLDTPGGGGGAFTWMVEHGRCAKLTSIWRFNDENEAGRSLLLRSREKDGAGEYLAIGSYESAGHVHAGTADQLEDGLVRRMVADLQEGRDALLIVGSNEGLADLNERISRTRAELGQVDADEARRTDLSDGSTAGAGDIVCSRRNARRLTTSKGQYVRNNDLWIVDRVDDGSLACHRKGDPGDQVVLPAAYVGEHTIGGYAVTPHRAQGKTVDRGYYYLPAGATQANSATMYVAMTRGRESNDVYVETKAIEDMMVGDQETYELAEYKQRIRADLEDKGLKEWKGEGPNPSTKIWYAEDDLLPTPAQQARWRLHEVMDQAKGGHFATEWANAYDKSMHSLERLDNEWRHYAQVTAERQLTALIGEERVSAAKQEPLYAQTLSAYGEARQIRPTLADSIARTVGKEDMEQVRNRFRHEITDDGHGRQDWLAGRYYSVKIESDASPDVADAADMMDQARGMIDVALQERIREAADPILAEPWMKALGPAPAEDSPRRQQWERATQEIAAYRAAHHINDDVHPLGKSRPGDGWQTRIQSRIQAYQHPVRDPGALGRVTAPTGMPARTERAIRAGRAIIVAGKDGPQPDGYVRVGGRDVDGFAQRVRQLTAASARIAVDASDRERVEAVWQALTPVERGQATAIEPGGHERPLWQVRAHTAQDELGHKGLIETVDGLDDDSRRQAIEQIERGMQDDQLSSSSSSPSQSMGPTPSPSIEVESAGPEPSGV
ncbi:MobF family relaxase [Bifidobacterium xylocopae]|uniref:AAA+ ATPase domain-containing protein n=1 Tax=Bifidobacterium xylocopae TaxID=2493119 RepID=A0A366KCB5_9BIFI|nr:MobF family relaxase [Bifidobacterium xylocopae]RBP98828.1 hypothetical protein CRD59_06980 [Bifidobacterium xylocopae]